jgi:hypothetical protein
MPAKWRWMRRWASRRPCLHGPPLCTAIAGPRRWHFLGGRRHLVSLVKMQVNRVARGVRYASTDAFQAIRTMGPLGRALKDAPNHVPEKQKFFGASKEFTHKKAESDKIVVTAGIALTVLGVVLATRGE